MAAGFRRYLAYLNITNEFPVHFNTISLYSWLLNYASKDAERKSSKDSSKPNAQKKYGVIVTKANSETPSKPLLVILGWNKSQDTGLLDTGDTGLFENKDWTTICLPVKSLDTFLKSGKKASLKIISLYIIELIKELAEKDKPVIFYIYGDGGCTVYSHIAAALSTPGQDSFNAFEIAGSICHQIPKPMVENIKKDPPNVLRNSLSSAPRRTKNPFAVIFQL